MSQMVSFEKLSFRNGGNLQVLFEYLLFAFHLEGKIAL